MFVTVCGSKWRGYRLTLHTNGGFAGRPLAGTDQHYTRDDAKREMEDVLVRNPQTAYRPCRCVDCTSERERQNTREERSRA